MNQRLIVGPEKTGAITPLQARDAAKAVKAARSKSGSKPGLIISDSIMERYLGSFGSGKVPAKSARKKSAPKGKAPNGSGLKTRI
jgi:hypothetical protein